MSRRIVALALVVAILVTVASLAILSLYRPGGAILLNGNVTEIEYRFTGPSWCWISLTGLGFALPKGGAMVTVWESLTYSGGSGEPASCTVQGATLGTRGFSLISTNSPLIVPQGTAELFNVTVATPSAYYSGPLIVNANVTSP